MVKPYCGSRMRALSRALAASLVMLPLSLLAESATQYAEPLLAPPLPAPSLKLEIRDGLFSPLREFEALAPGESSPVVEVPPVIEVPGVHGRLQPGTSNVNGDPAIGSPGPEQDVPTVVSEPAEPIVPPPTTRLTVTLDWYLNPQHATLLVAREKGMFTRRGLDVALVIPADPNVPAKLLAAGRTDLIVGHQPQLHLLIDRGVPLQRVATLISAPTAGLILRDSLENGRPETNLEGGRIGFTDVVGRDAMLSSVLTELLGTDSSLELVELKDVNYSVLDSMRAESVDGVMAHHRYLLPRQLADEGVTTRVLPVEEFGIPLHDGLILMANRDRLNGKRDAMRQLISALEEAALWIVNHPQEAWALLEASEPALADQANRESWAEIFPRLSLQPAAVDQGRYLRFEQFLLEADIIESDTPLERLAIDLGTVAP